MSTHSWTFTKDQLYHGMPLEELRQENVQRKSTCAFIQEAGIKLRLPQITIATAIVFFHRYFAGYRLKDHTKEVGTIAAACLFLAGKVEETPKKIKDVIEVYYKLTYGKDIVPESSDFVDLRDQLLNSEMKILQKTNFDLKVEHPYNPLMAYVKFLQGNKDFAQVSWNFVNDSLRTTLCLQFKPQLIATAAIYLASKFLKQEFPDRPRWWESFEAKLSELEEIGDQILDLYESSPNVDAIKAGKAAGPASKIESTNGSVIRPDAPQPPQVPPPPPETAPPPPPEPQQPAPPPPSSPKREGRTDVRKSPRKRSHSPRRRSRSRSKSPGHSRSKRSRSRSPTRRSHRKSSRSRSKSRSRSRSKSPRHGRSSSSYKSSTSSRSRHDDRRDDKRDDKKEEKRDDKREERRDDKREERRDYKRDDKREDRRDDKREDKREDKRHHSDKQ